MCDNSRECEAAERQGFRGPRRMPTNRNQPLEPWGRLMTDENTMGEEVVEETVAEEATAPDAGAPSDDAQGDQTATERVSDAAWKDVLAQLDGLAEAAGRWTRAAVDDPENRERARELRDHIEQMANNVGDTIDGAVSDAKATDVGDAFKDAAVKTGDAFKTVGAAFTNEVAPKMATAFRSAAEGMNRAAERMERPSPPPPPPSDMQGEVEVTDATVSEDSSQAPAEESSE